LDVDVEAAALQLAADLRRRHVVGIVTVGARRQQPEILVYVVRLTPQVRADDERLEAARAMWREGFRDRVQAMESILCVPSTEDLPTPLGDGDE
jgi:chromosome condensin MukBEF MukE localization factor